MTNKNKPVNRENEIIQELHFLNLNKPNLKLPVKDIYDYFDRIAFYEECIKLLQKLLKFYESTEEYEKCKITFDQIKIYKIKLNETKDFKQDPGYMGK